MKTITKITANALSWEIIGAAIEVHKVLGPGLLEKVYESAMMYELALRGLKASRQQNILVDYKGVKLGCKLRFDILVEDLVLCELKSTKEFHPIHEATLISYMKHLQKPKGILINFNVRNIFKEGQKTLGTYVIYVRYVVKNRRRSSVRNLCDLCALCGKKQTSIKR